MAKLARPVSTMAVDILYGSIEALPHPETGPIRLVYFGHKSEGQKKITRQVSEAIVMKLEASGLHIVNGLSEAQALLEAHGYAVHGPGDAEAQELLGDSSGDSYEDPLEPPPHFEDVPFDFEGADNG